MVTTSENIKAEPSDSLAVREPERPKNNHSVPWNTIFLTAITELGRIIGILTRRSEKILSKVELESVSFAKAMGKRAHARHAAEKERAATQGDAMDADPEATSANEKETSAEPATKKKKKAKAKDAQEPSQAKDMKDEVENDTGEENPAPSTQEEQEGASSEALEENDSGENSSKEG